LESKIDIGSFENLVRAVENKADRSDLDHAIRTERFKENPSGDVSDKETILREQQHHLDRAVQKIMLDIEQKVQGVEREYQLTSKDFATELENLKSVTNMSLTKKVDYRDFDQLTGQVHQRAELEKVQNMVTQLRNDVVGQVLNLKKDMQLK
jgi:hypothetical protein